MMRHPGEQYRRFPSAVTGISTSQTGQRRSPGWSMFFCARCVQISEHRFERGFRSPEIGSPQCSHRRSVVAPIGRGSSHAPPRLHPPVRTCDRGKERTGQQQAARDIDAISGYRVAVVAAA